MKPSFLQTCVLLAGFSVALRVLPYALDHAGMEPHPAEIISVPQDFSVTPSGLRMWLSTAASFMSWYPANFSPFGALLLFAGATLSRWQGMLLAVVSLFVGDVLIVALSGHPEWVLRPDALMVYVGFAVMVALGWSWPTRTAGLGSVPQMATGVTLALVGEVLFFVLTNFAVWACNEPKVYPHTPTGLLACYIAAIPFARNSFLSSLVFSGLFFSPLMLGRRVEATVESSVAVVA